MMIPLGTLIVLAIVVPWYAALYQRDGWTYITSFIFGENIARTSEGVGVNAERPVWFYLPVVFSDSFPWSLFLFPAAAVLWLRTRRLATGADAAFRDPDAAVALDSRHRRLLHVFRREAGPLHLPDCARGRRARRDCHRPCARAGRPRRRASRAVTVVIGVLLVVAGAGFLLLFNSALAVYALAGAAFVGVAAMLAVPSALLLAARQRAARRSWPSSRARGDQLGVRAAGAAELRALQAGARLPPRSRRAPAGGRRRHYNVALPSMVYYLRRHIDVFSITDVPATCCARGARSFVMASRDDYERAIKPAETVPLCRVELAADRRRQAEERPRPRSLARSAADHEQVCGVRLRAQDSGLSEDLESCDRLDSRALSPSSS